MINQSQATDIVYREAQLQKWLNGRTSYRPEEVPAGINPPTNAERSALEVFRFHRDKPERYFLYVNADQNIVTTWTGETLGTCQFGKPHRDNFGGMRVSITVQAVNGCRYYGTYFKSAGDYARVRKARQNPKPYLTGDRRRFATEAEAVAYASRVAARRGAILAVEYRP